MTEPAAPSDTIFASAAAWCVRHRGLLLVVFAFVASAFLIPTLAPVAVSDDALHLRSSEILMRDGHLQVLPLMVASLVGQIIWSAPFTWLFGDTAGVLRVSTIVAVTLSAFPMYGLLRELRITRQRSALGTALYLFNPLMYSLAFTFMTDAYLVSGIVAATFCLLRGLRRGEIRWFVGASVIAGTTFSIRQQAIFIVLSLLAFLIVGVRSRTSRGTLRLAIATTAPFAVLVAAYFFWYHVIQGTPPGSAQVSVTSQWLSANPLDAFVLTRRLTLFEVMYAALFLAPLALAVVPRVRTIATTLSRRGWIWFGAFVALLLFGMVWYGNGDARMPYASQFLSPSGLGPPNDVHGGRAPLMSPDGQTVLTLVCLLSALVLGVVLFARIGRRTDHEDRQPIALVVALLLGQAVAAIVSSWPLQDSAITRDRYLLPLLPLAIALTLWALRSVRIVTVLAWGATVGFALISVVGTHDFLSFQSTVWSSARAAHTSGVPYRSLDAGASWDAYHLYEFSYQHKIKLEFPTGLSNRELRKLGNLRLSKNDGEAWWIGFYAPASNSRYVISAEPLLSYRIVGRAHWFSWFRQREETIYQLRKIRPKTARPR